MRKPCLWIAAGVMAGLLAVAAPATAQTAPATASSTVLLRSPELTATTLALLHAKLTGQRPDFRELARRSADYQRSSAFNREAVADRLSAAYAAAFDHASLDAVYTINLNTSLLQYDPGHRGWPTDFTEGKFIPFANPQGGGLQLSFDNVDAFNVLPAQPAEAERFAERNNLNMHGAYAGFVTLRYAFRVSAAPPALDTMSAPMTGHILAGEMLQTAGSVLYVFPLAVDASATPQAPASLNGLPALRDGTLNGVALGMSAEDAVQAAKAKFPNAAMIRDAVSVTLYDGLQGSTHPSCGRPPRVFTLEPVQEDPPGVYTACLQFDVTNGAVSLIRSNQFLAPDAMAGADQALREKYGRPLQVAQGGSGHTDSWVGANAAGMPTTIEATLQPVGTATALRIRVHPWVDPQPRRSAPPTTTPKL